MQGKTKPIFAVLAALVLAGAGWFFRAELAGLLRGGPAVPFHESFDSALRELKFEELKEGTGDVAEAGKLIEFHYEEWLPDGTKFDSSVERKETIKVQLGRAQLLPGLDHGIVGMKAGGRRKIQIPAFLAFGEKGVGKVVPPNSPIVAEIELIQVENGPADSVEASEGQDAP